MSKATVQHVRYKNLYLSEAPHTEQNREITNFNVLLATTSVFILNLMKEVAPSGTVNTSTY